MKSEGFTVDNPPSFLRLEAPEIFLFRITLTKNFRPDNPPFFFPKNWTRRGGGYLQ